jgi:transposase-like protein
MGGGKKMIKNDEWNTINDDICPVCRSNNIEQTATHSDKGFNGYKCNDCNTTWSN